MVGQKLLFLFNWSLSLFFVVYTLELTSLCEERVFLDRKINSFFQLRLKDQIESISEFILKPENNNFPLKEINDIIKDIYSEDCDRPRIFAKIQKIENDISFLRSNYIISNQQCGEISKCTKFACNPLNYTSKCFPRSWICDGNGDCFSELFLI